MTRAHLDLPERPHFATLKTFPRALSLYPLGNEAVRLGENLRVRRKEEAMKKFKATIGNKFVAPWIVIASMLFLATAQPSAYGLEFPMTTHLALPDQLEDRALAATPDSTDALYGGFSLKASSKSSLFSSELALVSTMSKQVEMARTQMGAKKVAKAILIDEYGYDETEYSCLNRLWMKESHWNYKAHNYRSGAHGNAQALPAVKMEVIATDWRTNPVTQIRWGIRYIDIRYDTPCKAWAQWKRSRFY